MKKELISPSIEVVRIESGLGKSRYWKWLSLFGFVVFYIKTFRFSIRQKPDIINAHSLTVLPLCALLKFFTKAKIIYDAHELETETNDSKGIRKVIAKVIERSFIGIVDYTLVVSPSIKEWYQKTYALSQLEVVRNIPDNLVTKESSQSVRNLASIPEDDLVFIYVGALIKGRGIEMTLRAFKNTSQNKHVVFMGYGPLEQLIVKEVNQQKNIHFVQAVKPDQVLGIVSSADVGLSFIENTSLSYYYCLPNKVFEYISAGIPFICSDLPDLRNEFHPYGVSWFVNSEESLLKTINAITQTDLNNKRENIKASKSMWNWNDEKQIITSIYSKLLYKN